MPRITRYEDSEIDFPISLSKEEAVYLIDLAKGQVTLGVIKSEGRDSYTSLRGRVYIQRDKMINNVFENNLNTSTINSLIDKKYIIKYSETKDYHLLSPHPEIVGYILSINHNREGGIFSIFLNKKETKIKCIRALEPNEKTKLKQKANRLGFPAKIVLKEGLALGMTHHFLYQMLDTNVPCHFILEPKTDTVYQVFPKDKYSPAEKPDKVEIESEITDNFIRIKSANGSTGYILKEKRDPIDIKKIEQDVKEALKILKEHKVKVKGKSKALAMLKDSSYLEELESYNRLYSEYWETLLKESKELVKEGVYKGGFEHNPKYKKAWDTEYKISTLYNKSLKVRKLQDLHLSAKNIINKNNYSDIKYISYTII